MSPDRAESLSDQFLTFKRNSEGCSPRTIAAYSDILTRFRSFLGDRDLRAVTEDDLVLFTGAHLNKHHKLHARSRIPYISCIRGFYAWLHKTQHMAINPASRLAYPKAGKPLPDVMSLANAERLMAAPDFGELEGVRDAAILALLIGCGLRIGGLVGLNRSSLTTFEQRAGKVSESRLALRVMEKGQKERLLPVPREAALLLRVYLDHPERDGHEAVIGQGDEPLFLNTRNRRIPPHEWIGERRRMSARGVQRMIARYAAQAGIPAEQAHPHALRHLFGTELTESDTPEGLTGALMGHSSAQSTRIYTHLAMKKKASALDQANPLAKIRTPASDLLARMKQ